MSVLVLRLAGPLQSWGARSRFARRMTEEMPTKSGILGLLAAAQGRRRCDEIEDLLHLELAVRTEQQGVLLRDFHTAHHQVTGAAMPLTNRYYWSDAVFTAHIGGPTEILEGLSDALADPVYPLYLGRRSCVPEGRMVLGVRDGGVAESVRGCEWAVSKWQRRRRAKESVVRLAVQADASVFPEMPVNKEINDVPLSFDPELRQYRTRMVVDTSVLLQVADDRQSIVQAHDPMALLGGEK